MWFISISFIADNYLLAYLLESSIRNVTEKLTETAKYVFSSQLFFLTSAITVILLFTGFKNKTSTHIPLFETAKNQEITRKKYMIGTITTAYFSYRAKSFLTQHQTSKTNNVHYAQPENLICNSIDSNKDASLGILYEMVRLLTFCFCFANLSYLVYLSTVSP
mmetsp:Transcript_38910/g.56801  ORF Transcript_38910/g.56801 Transcript_38910/m.56801 type:complete len:163 (-) Transcript_38910:227-715(-)